MAKTTGEANVLRDEIENLRQVAETLQGQVFTLSRLLDHLPDIILLKDANSVYRYVNKAFCDTIGKRPSEILGKTDYDIFPQEEAELYTRSDRKTLESGETGEYYEKLQKGEEVIDIYLIKKPYFDGGGQFKGVLVTARDVTSQLQQQEEARKSEQLYRSLAANIPDTSVFIIDRDINYLLAEGKEIERFGMTQEDFLSTPFDQLFTGEVAAYLRQEYSRAFEGEQFESDFKLYTEYYHQTYVPLKNANNEIEKVLILSQNITSAKKAEEQLKASETKFRTIFSSSPIAVYLYDTDGCLLDVNNAGLQLAGVDSPDCLRGVSLFDNPTITPEKRIELEQNGIVHLISEINFDNIARLGLYKPHRTGIAKVDWTVSLIEGLGLLVQMQDVTERLQMEERLAESEARFRKFFEHSTDGMVLVNREGTVLSWNSALEAITGYEEDEVLGSKIWDVNYMMNPAENRSPELYDRLKELTSNFYKNPETYENTEPQDRVICRKDGTHHHIEVDTFPYSIGSDVLIGAVIRDITEAKLREEELEISRNNLIEAQQIGKIGSFVSDVSTQEWHPSPVLKELLGIPEGIVLTLNNFLNLVHPDDRGALQRELRRSIDEKDTFTIDYRFSRPLDSKIIWLSSRGHTVYDEQGRITRQKGTLQDITERKRIELQLYENERRLQRITETAPGAIFQYKRYLNGDEKFVFISKRAPYYFGAAVDELLENSELAWQKIHPDDIQRVRNKLDESERTLRVWQVDYRIVTPDGSIRWMRNTAVPEHSIWESATLWTGIAVDVSELKETEEALRESEIKYRTVADFTYDWEYWIDENDEFKYISPSCTDVTGYTPQQFMQSFELLFDIVHPDEREAFKEHFYSQKKAEQTAHLDFRLICKDGTEKWISQYGRPVFDPDGNYIGRRISNRNITARKLAEDALIESEAQLREANAAKDKFFSIIAHDLKNPFFALINLSEIIGEIADASEPEKIKRIAGQIEVTSKQTFDLLENLLQWSRSQTGKIQVVPVELQAAELVNKTARQLFPLLEAKDITLAINIDSRSTLFADEQMTATVIRNLLSNAIKFTPEGGSIRVESMEKEDHVLLSFTDTGIGMDKVLTERLFRIDQPVSRDGTNKEKGTGLGLILCHEFVSRNNGTIEVNSEPGKGTTFTITLPKTES